MIQRTLPVIIFAAIAIAIIQIINHSFTHTYKTVETTVSTPYAKAQKLYEAELASGGY